MLSTTKQIHESNSNKMGISSLFAFSGAVSPTRWVVSHRQMALGGPNGLAEMQHFEYFCFNLKTSQKASNMLMQHSTTT